MWSKRVKVSTIFNYLNSETAKMLSILKWSNLILCKLKTILIKSTQFFLNWSFWRISSKISSIMSISWFDWIAIRISYTVFVSYILIFQIIYFFFIFLTMVCSFTMYMWIGNLGFINKTEHIHAFWIHHIFLVKLIQWRVFFINEKFIDLLLIHFTF